MVRSMIAGVAGLKTHQSKLDVIGNNIANVNTWGFKSSSFNFQDSMYANSINSSAGNDLGGGAGGRNASQVGYGVTTGSISSEFGTGAPAPSSNPLDCMIDGTGFFLVGNMINGSFTNVAESGLNLSRVGIFRVDGNGYLVDDQRSYVYGYALKPGTGIPEVPATRGAYTVNGASVKIEDHPAGGFNVTIGGITVRTTKTSYKEQVQDWVAKASTQGKKYTDEAGLVSLSKVSAKETGNQGEYEMDFSKLTLTKAGTVTVTLGGKKYDVELQDGDGAGEFISKLQDAYDADPLPDDTVAGPITSDVDIANGKFILRTGGDALTDVKIGDVYIEPQSEDTNPLSGYSISLSNYQEADPTKGQEATVNIGIEANMTGDDTANAVNLNQAGMWGKGTFKMLNPGNTREASIAAEYADELSSISIPIDPDTGEQYEIQSYKINEDGTIVGVDVNNRTIAIGQLALVTVENPNGLEKTSGYYYSIGANAGSTGAIKPNGGPAGRIMGNYLEMANVDLANEFSQMITTQRGYQANSKIITVTDQMLEELVNLKR